MTRLTILEYPDPRLRTRAVPVDAVDARLRELIDDMLETMYSANGIGLAATQVDVHRRLLVADVSESRREPRVFVNPEILARAGTETSQEGCLSVPDLRGPVARIKKLDVLDSLHDDAVVKQCHARRLYSVCRMSGKSLLLGGKKFSAK